MNVKLLRVALQLGKQHPQLDYLKIPEPYKGALESFCKMLDSRGPIREQVRTLMEGYTSERLGEVLVAVAEFAENKERVWMGLLLPQGTYYLVQHLRKYDEPRR